MRIINVNIKRRCSEELRRVFLNHMSIVRRCGFTTGQAYSWWYEESFPSANSLETLHHEGVDILYIITGERNPNLKSGGDTRV